MKDSLSDPAFLTLLLPLPGARASGSGQVEQEGYEAAVGAGKRKLQKENAKLKEKLKAAEEEGKKAKLIRPAVKKMPVKVPKELWGLDPMKNKERICYGFQMGSCKQSGDKCDKGLHICMKCWKKDHGAMKCSS